MPSKTAVIRACLKYDAMGIDVSAIIADVLRLDAVEVRMDKPCGKSHISDRKKCSSDKLKTLTSDLKAGDEGAKRRVAEGKKSAQRKQQLNRAVERDRGKKSEVIEPRSKLIKARDMGGNVIQTMMHKGSLTIVNRHNETTTYPPKFIKRVASSLKERMENNTPYDESVDASTDDKTSGYQAKIYAKNSERSAPFVTLLSYEAKSPQTVNIGLKTLYKLLTN